MAELEKQFAFGQFGQWKLQARLFWCPSTAAPKDLTTNEFSGLAGLADDGSMALEIVQDCESLLRLLRTAATGGTTMEAKQVTALLDRVLENFGPGSDLDSYLGRTAELFRNLEPLPPMPAVTRTRNTEVVGV
jgi:hypothetical protein